MLYVDERPLTSGQVAALFNVTVETVADWAEKGKISSFKTPGGHRRFHRAAVEALLAPAEPEGKAG